MSSTPLLSSPEYPPFPLVSANWQTEVITCQYVKEGADSRLADLKQHLPVLPGSCLCCRRLFVWISAADTATQAPRRVRVPYEETLSFVERLGATATFEPMDDVHNIVSRAIQDRREKEDMRSFRFCSMNELNWGIRPKKIEEIVRDHLELLPDFRASFHLYRCAHMDIDRRMSQLRTQITKHAPREGEAERVASVIARLQFGVQKWSQIFPFDNKALIKVETESGESTPDWKSEIVCTLHRTTICFYSRFHKESFGTEMTPFLKGGFNCVYPALKIDKAEVTSKAWSIFEDRHRLRSQIDRVVGLQRRILVHPNILPAPEIIYYQRPEPPLRNVFLRRERPQHIIRIGPLYATDLKNEINELPPLDFNSPDQVKSRIEHCAHVMRELLEGIHHLHNSGYVHGDLKPQNVLVDRTRRNGKYIVADLDGIVREGESISMETKTIIDAERARLQNRHYPISEEERKKMTTAYKSNDVFALGLLFLEMWEPFLNTDFRKIYLLKLGRINMEELMAHRTVPHEEIPGNLSWMISKFPERMPYNTVYAFLGLMGSVLKMLSSQDERPTSGELLEQSRSFVRLMRCPSELAEQAHAVYMQARKLNPDLSTCDALSPQRLVQDLVTSHRTRQVRGLRHIIGRRTALPPGAAGGGGAAARTIPLS